MKKFVPKKQSRPRGMKKNDPRIYDVACSEQEAAERINATGGKLDKLNFLLRRAIHHNDSLTAQAALRAGADPNSQNIFGEGPMLSACQNGTIEMLRLLLDHGANLGADQFGVPPLIHAVQNWREDLVVEMIKAGATLNVRENATLKTALHVAAGHRATKGILKRLLEAGADPREVDLGGRTAREWSELREGTPEMIRILKAAEKKWECYPLPKTPKRRPKSKLEKVAKMYLGT